MDDGSGEQRINHPCAVILLYATHSTQWNAQELWKFFRACCKHLLYRVTSYLFPWNHSTSTIMITEMLQIHIYL